LSVWRWWGTFRPSFPISSARSTENVAAPAVRVWPTSVCGAAFWLVATSGGILSSWECAVLSWLPWPGMDARPLKLPSWSKYPARKVKI
jgi:hypothetical protein